MTRVEPDILRLAAIVRASDDAIISHSLDGTIEFWNPSAERMFDYTADQAIGQRVEMLIAPHHRDAERHLLEEIRRGNAVRHFETVAITRSGATLDISLSVSPLVTPDGTVLGAARIARDMSRQRAAERDAFRLAAIVDSSDDAIASKDLDGIVQTWNGAAERMFGYAAEEIVGRSISMIIPPERLGEEDEVLGRIRRGQSVDHFETVRRRKDGTPIEISLTVSPIRDADGRVVGASKIARDISAQHRLARAAEDANRVKDEFLAMLSHELRTPLNAVLGYTRMLRDGRIARERQDRAIDTIERNAHVLSQLVSDVLDVSTIVTGKVELKLRRCDLAAVIEAAVDTVRPAAEAKGIALSVERPREPVRARCDSDRLQQVFWNLLANAIKFTPAGGQVRVRIEQPMAGHARMSVNDTGIGISPEALPFVFQRFWQGEGSGNHVSRGLGLGLALARYFTELHGGTITASSEGQGRGATFTVTLPLAGVEAAPNAATRGSALAE